MLEWPFYELFFSNISLWKQYKYIAFNIFPCRILIISYKMWIITRLSNEARNELTIYRILCWNVIIFYRQEFVSLFQVREKFGGCRNSKQNFSGSCFVKLFRWQFCKTFMATCSSFHRILYFAFLRQCPFIKYYPLKVPQNCFNFFSYPCSGQTWMQVSKF